MSSSDEPPGAQPEAKKGEAGSAGPVDAQAIARLVTATRSGVRRGFVEELWILSTIVGATVAIVGGLPGVFEPGPWLAWALLSAATAWVLRRRRVELDHAHVALLLGDLDRSRVGALIDALEWPDRRVREVARLRLTHLLPGLTPVDDERLTQEQRTGLYDRLGIVDAWRHPDFVRAALRALPAIGDEYALPPVRRLARVFGFTQSLRQTRTAARACLLGLERRVLARRVAEAQSRAPDRQQVDGPSVASRAPVPAHVDAALQRVEAEIGNPPQLRLPFLLAAWGLLVPGCAGLAVMLIAQGYWYAALPVAAVGVWASQLHRLTLTARHRRIAAELAALDDVNAIGRLAEALAWPEPTLRAGAIAALTRLLPRLRSSDAGLLAGYPRSCLYQSLNREMARRYPEFIVSLLKALEQVGDLDAVPAVERLAHWPGRSSRERLVRDAAQECLPYLHAVASQNQQSQVLLRAACAPERESEVLVRPAGTVGACDPDALLRSVAAPELSPVNAETDAAEG